MLAPTAIAACDDSLHINEVPGLGVLFSGPDEPMHLRQIIAAVGGGQGQVQRELEQLHRAGLVP